MSTCMEVHIQTTSVDGQVVCDQVIQTIIGVPGPTGATGADGVDGADGADGTPGPQGDPGAGVPTGGAAGQVPVKQSATDFDLAWSGDFVIDPATGRVGIGTANPLVPFHSVSNATWAAGFEGHTNNYTGMKFVNRHTTGRTLFVLGEDNVNTGSTPCYFERWGSTSAYPNRLHISAIAEIVMQLNGQKVGIGTAPSTTLHVNGPARVGSYTLATVPSASSVGAGAIIYVSDETGGAVMAFSDGADWRRVSDRAVIS